MVYLILLGVTFLIQLLAASWYVLACNKELKDTFKYKMLCSGIYVADIFLVGAMSESFKSLYYYIVLAGILLTFIADVTESKLKNSETIFTVSRSSSNLLLFFGVIYLSRNLFGTEFHKEPFVIAAVLIVSAIALIIIVTDKILRRMNLLPVVTSLAFCLISLMTGITAQKTGIGTMQSLSFLLIMGSGAVFISDFLRFGKKREEKMLLRTNLYYFGLMIFSCSVASIK